MSQDAFDSQDASLFPSTPPQLRALRLAQLAYERVEADRLGITHERYARGEYALPQQQQQQQEMATVMAAGVSSAATCLLDLLLQLLPLFRTVAARARPVCPPTLVDAAEAGPSASSSFAAQIGEPSLAVFALPASPE